MCGAVLLRRPLCDECPIVDPLLSLICLVHLILLMIIKFTFMNMGFGVWGHTHSDLGAQLRSRLPLGTLGFLSL